MKRILLTGMSGTGKSTLIEALIKQRQKAEDLDTDAFSHWVEISSDGDAAGTPVEPGRDWIWREDRVQRLLDITDACMLFVSGCAPNMGKFLPQFDHVILLSAPADVILARLATRTGNEYGKGPEQAARVLSLIETVEPLLRRAAGHEIDTSAPRDEVVAAVMEIARS